LVFTTIKNYSHTQVHKHISNTFNQLAIPPNLTHSHKRHAIMGID